MKFLLPLLLLSVSFTGCVVQPAIRSPQIATIPVGVDPFYNQGDAVRNKLSGQVGIVTGGFYDPVFGIWRYKVRYMAVEEARIRQHPTDGQTWERSYELELLERAALVKYPLYR
jgi:hypothetical protein